MKSIRMNAALVKMTLESEMLALLKTQEVNSEYVINSMKETQEVIKKQVDIIVQLTNMSQWSERAKYFALLNSRIINAMFERCIDENRINAAVSSYYDNYEPEDDIGEDEYDEIAKIAKEYK